jgi:hypothetical protein
MSARKGELDRRGGCRQFGADDLLPVGYERGRGKALFAERAFRQARQQRRHRPQPAAPVFAVARIMLFLAHCRRAPLWRIGFMDL